MNTKLLYYDDLLPDTPVTVVAEEPAPDDEALVTRIIAAYQRSAETVRDLGGPIWTSIADKSREVHEALVAGNLPAVTAFLRRPHLSNLHYGFEMMHASAAEKIAANPDLGRRQARWAHDVLVRVAEVTGAIRTYLPEIDTQERPWDPDALIEALDRVLGVPLRFPNTVPQEWGCASRRGAVAYRATQAIYQAWRLRQLSAFAGGTKTVEIGAGLGRTAFYATLFGTTDYTIVDLPLANVAQAYFLGRALGPERIVLEGEERRADAWVRIQNAAWFPGTDERFDLALNADSLTEMGADQMDRYWAQLRQRATVFVSINQEALSVRVADLAARAGMTVKTLRNVSPVRKGYIEEIFFFEPEAAPPSFPAATSTRRWWQFL